MRGLWKRGVVGDGRLAGFFGCFDCDRPPLRKAGVTSGTWKGEGDGYALIFSRGQCTKLFRDWRPVRRCDELCYHRWLYALCFVQGQFGLDVGLGVLLFFSTAPVGRTLGVIGPASKAVLSSLMND